MEGTLCVFLPAHPGCPPAPQLRRVGLTARPSRPIRPPPSSALRSPVPRPPLLVALRHPPRRCQRWQSTTLRATPSMDPAPRCEAGRCGQAVYLVAFLCTDVVYTPSAKALPFPQTAVTGQHPHQEAPGTNCGPCAQGQQGTQEDVQMIQSGTTLADTAPAWHASNPVPVMIWPAVCARLPSQSQPWPRKLAPP